MHTKTYRVRVNIVKQSNGGEQVQISFTKPIEGPLGATRTVIQFHGTRMCFFPAGNVRHFGNFTATGEKITCADTEIVKRAKSFIGEYRILHKDAEGYVYIDAAEVQPLRLNLPPRRKNDVEQTAEQTGRGVVAALLKRVKALEAKRDDAMEVACECDRQINSLKEAIKVMEGAEDDGKRID